MVANPSSAKVPRNSNPGVGTVVVVVSSGSSVVVVSPVTSSVVVVGSGQVMVNAVGVGTSSGISATVIFPSIIARGKL